MRSATRSFSRVYLILSAVFFLYRSVPSTAETTALPAAIVQTPLPDHQAWSSLLQRYVNPQGLVNYSSWRNDMQPLNAYLQSLASTPPTPTWSRENTMAFWINAYNAFTIKLILDNPVKSIRDLHNGNPWDIKWIRLGNTTYSLNQIEHDILRAQFKDARIHFALNCAAISCPPLCRKAFTANNLNSLLDQLTRSFVRSTTTVNHNSRQITVSSLFNWYAADFGKLSDFLNLYLDKPVDQRFSVIFDDYNWAINAQ